MRVVALLGANALMLVAGLGLLPWLGVARSWRELTTRSGLGYLCGLVATGIIAANIALVHVSFGWAALSVFAGAAACTGAWRLRGTERPSWQRPGWITVVGLAVLAAVLVEYGRAFTVAPLNRYDAWAIWGLKGHALYAFGWADPTVFAGAQYRFANLDYPLLLPALEAVDFHAMGAVDTRVLHLQFLLVLAAALLALAALLRDRVPPLLLWPSLLAIALAPAVFGQLLTAYADVPLALIFAVGVAAAGRWLVTNERWSLTVAAFCFAAALLTKNEGSLFVLAAFLGLFVASRERWRPLAIAAAADLALLLPWKVYVRIHDIESINYSLADSFDVDHINGRLGVLRIAFRTLGGEMIDPLSWGLLAPLFALLVITALATGLRALPLFALVLAIVSWLGLSWIYVISHFEYSSYLDSTKERVISSVVLGGATLTPLLGTEIWARGLRARGSGRPRSAGERTP
ncbi:hypothetical protein BH18ACT12_BH18ACT12_14070 [soil metagenome]